MRTSSCDEHSEIPNIAKHSLEKREKTIFILEIILRFFIFSFLPCKFPPWFCDNFAEEQRVFCKVLTKKDVSNLLALYFSDIFENQTN